MRITSNFRHNQLTKHRLLWFFLAAMSVAGCASAPPIAVTVAAPPLQSLEQYLQEAGRASAEGSKSRAHDLYRTAAKTYPTSKEPWLRLTEAYFDATNYGQAILAAQEVLQRDPTDSVATSVLAVSGLRVSASALSMLRQQQPTLNGSTRAEAEDLAHVLRDLIGEPVLVPRPVGGAPAPLSTTARKRSLPVAVTQTAGPSPAAVLAKTPAPMTAPQKSDASNPFSVLKN